MRIFIAWFAAVGRFIPHKRAMYFHNEILPHYHSSFYNELKCEQELFQVSGLCLVTSLTRVYVSMFVGS